MDCSPWLPMGICLDLYSSPMECQIQLCHVELRRMSQMEWSMVICHLFLMIPLQATSLQFIEKWLVKCWANYYWSCQLSLVKCSHFVFSTSFLNVLSLYHICLCVRTRICVCRYIKWHSLPNVKRNRMIGGCCTPVIPALERLKYCHCMFFWRTQESSLTKLFVIPPLLN